MAHTDSPTTSITAEIITSAQAQADVAEVIAADVADEITANVAACERLVKVLSERTGIAFSFGYLGNCSGIPGTPAYRDDRSWYAFAAHPGRVGTSKDSIGGYHTSELSHLVTTLRGAVQLAIVQAEAR